MFYKLIVGKNIVGVARRVDFRKYQPKHHLVLFSTLTDAQFIEVKGILYHDDWMRSVADIMIEYEPATVTRIDEDEYNALLEAFETNEEITVEEESNEPEVQEEAAEEKPDVTVEFVRAAKIAQMSRECESIIIGGFDVILSDGEAHHFSLTTNDQINLITLSSMIADGADYIPYHADGELCMYYSREDAAAILETATHFKTYHTTYFNSLKFYIESLDNVEEIHAVKYGIEIPAEYQSPVFASILNPGEAE